MRKYIPILFFVFIYLVASLGPDFFFRIPYYLEEIGMAPSIIVLLVFLVIFLASAVKVLPEYERGVIFRLGRVIGAKGPGLIILIPFIDKMVRVSLRVITLDVPTQDIITKDNVSVKVDAVVYFRVVDPVKAIVNVENYMYATSQISQTTLRSVCGQAELDELLSQREKLNEKLQEIIDRETDAWGVKVVSVELKRIDLPEELVKAMARQAEAERERRAKIISAEAEYQAAQKLVEAAELLSKEPMAMQLRYLETLNTIGQKGTKTIVFPFPTEIMEFIKKISKKES